MLFTEPGFLFLFLPAVIAAVRGLQAFGAERGALVVLALASFLFYGIAYPPYLLLLAASICGNYVLVKLFLSWDGPSARRCRCWLAAAVAFNLGMLGYFKYRDFFLANLAAAGGPDFHLEALILPVGISFYVFEQLALVVDVYRGYRPEKSLLKHALWVAFFPHLVAGPIMRHQELVPQFERMSQRAPWTQDLAIGLTIFAIGLFKKAVLADSMAPLADLSFNAAHGGGVGTVDAWLSVIAYALQIYFDFSGYSDMAIGLARMLGLSLPLNFNSPYKAPNIIEFWRRWHMTLSRFLRDYLYVPLGGGRSGAARRWLNLFLTMLLGGLWHGASWNFVIWGGLHGAYLAINHAFRHVVPQRQSARTKPSLASQGLGWALTMAAVLIAWVPFRANTLPEAITMWDAMFGATGQLSQLFDARAMLALTGVAAVAVLMPNTQDIMRLSAGDDRGEPSAGQWPSRLVWQPGYAWPAAAGVMIAISLLALNDGQSPFIYFRF